jgi:translation initiation factor 2B subunit (eIF-2B alpha/beta/delta family)
MGPLVAAALLLEARIAELREDRTHGGSWMARRAVETLVELAGEDAASGEELLEQLLIAGRALTASRPAVGAIAGAVGRLLATAHASSQLEADELRRVIEDEGTALISSRDRAGHSIAIQIRPRLEDALVVTHSASATVREALLYGRPCRVVCTVSAPFEEGRAFADELRAEGLEVELVEDADGAEALMHASLLLVGADTIFRDGSICNKIGTAELAAAAGDLGVPVVVAAELIKLAPIGPNEALEQIQGEQFFDVTPAEDVDEIVTEEGAFASADVGMLLDRTPFLRDGYELLRPLRLNA